MEWFIILAVFIPLGFCFITLVGLVIEFIAWCDNQQIIKKEYFADDK